MASLAGNSVRHIDALRDMEAQKRHYEIGCSHHSLNLLASKEKRITCAIYICGRVGPMCRTGLF
jgi:hypothetical protein